MRKLSVAIITFNEAHNIERCIRSVLPVADEVVVMDSHSTDRTRELAEGLGARVILQSFLGHIGQKNEVLKHVSNEFVLSLDADEWLSDALQHKIGEIKKSGTADGYLFNRLNNYCGKWIRHGAWYPDRKLRLWEHTKGAWGGINPHDEFRMNPGAVIEAIPLDLLHQTYRSVAQHRQKTNYYADLAAKAYLESGKRSGILKIVFSPVVRFIRDCFFLGGILDGRYGIIIAWLNATEVFKKYVRLYRLQSHS